MNKQMKSFRKQSKKHTLKINMKKQKHEKSEKLSGNPNQTQNKA